MKSLFLSAIVIGASAYAAICILLYFNQRNMIYLPTSETEASGATAVIIASGDQSLKIWRIGNASKAIIYFGGNAENVAWNIPAFREYFSNYSVYLVNYRGYGGSTGSPTESGLYQDALVLYDYLKTQHKEFYVIGRSLGAAIGTYLASEREVEKLILVTPFDSALNMAKELYPLFPVSLLLKDRYDSVRYANNVSAKIGVIIAEQDGIVPRDRSDALIDAFSSSQISVKIIKNANHNSLDNFTDYSAALIAFVSME